MARSATDRFDGHDLRDELRPPGLFDRDTGRLYPDVGDNEGFLPEPVLDAMHGRVNVVSDSVVTIATYEGLYHELVELLDDVFDVPCGYSVYWVDLSGQSESVALIRLRDDETVRVHSPDEPVSVIHHYQRGDYSGMTAVGHIRDGGVVALNREDEELTGPVTPSKAALIADGAVRGEASPESGINGWTWWTLSDGETELDSFR